MIGCMKWRCCKGELRRKSQELNWDPRGDASRNVIGAGLHEQHVPCQASCQNCAPRYGKAVARAMASDTRLSSVPERQSTGQRTASVSTEAARLSSSIQKNISK